MNILYNHRIASKDGQYVHVEELTNALKEQGHIIRFICPGFTDAASFGADGGLAARLKSTLPRAFYEVLELTYSLVIALKLVREIVRKRPDFIYERYSLYQPAGVIIAKLFQLPIILEVNAPLADERAKHSGLSLVWFAKWIEGFTWRHASIVLPVTKVLADMVVTAGTSKEKVQVVHNGINRHILESMHPTYAEKGDHSKLVIGFIGFIARWHKLEIALDAIAAMGNKNIYFICVGEGDCRPELEEYARSLGITDQVEFTGLVTRDNVFDYLQQFDIALQPSVTAYASPLKIFEYMANGSLIIAPAWPNIREILSENNAVLFDPDLEGDFYDKLCYSIANFKNMQHLRRKARETITEKKFIWQENSKRVVESALNEKK